MDAKGVLARLAVFLVTALLVVGAVAAVSFLYEQPESDGPDREPLPENPEFAQDRISPDRLEASGSVAGIVQANRSYRGRRVLVDVAHENRLNREDIQPLVSALTDAGHEVQLLQERSRMDRRLRNADALIVVDPAQPYRHAEVRRVNQFTQRGGRLLLLGEPNINAIQAGLFGVSISEQRSQLTELASSYGISFDTEYIYNVERNDGNYQRVLTRPSPSTDIEGFERGATYIAAPVHVRHGKRLMIAAKGTKQLGVEGGGPYPLAVQHRSKNVTAVGDASLFAPVHASVADNEEFIAAIGSFLVSGSRQLPDEDREAAETTPGDSEDTAQSRPGETPVPERPSTQTPPDPTPPATQTPEESA
jgi:hypothetical protein